MFYDREACKVSGLLDASAACKIIARIFYANLVSTKQADSWAGVQPLSLNILRNLWINSVFRGGVLLMKKEKSQNLLQQIGVDYGNTRTQRLQALRENL